MAESLVVNEIFFSIQGESSYAGLPCVFVRLTGCDLRCSYCDTSYAFSEGKKMTIDEICSQVYHFCKRFNNLHSKTRLPIIEITGGEPLLQKETPILLKRFCSEGFTVLLETSGAHDISVTPGGVHRIMDIKCPSSGESHKNLWNNINHLTPEDEVKFVIATREDYEFAKNILTKYSLAEKCPVLFSWAEPLAADQKHHSLKPPPQPCHPVTRRELAEWILADALPVRLQIQMHKIIWPNIIKGV
ncbi:MAG: radical SAM protein [Verrucomicrobiae bacterium]|nr:radical SAM protein [Verrucomicrobiae bacterium]